MSVGNLRNLRNPGDPGNLGIGIGWRPEIAEAVEALPGIDWVEAVAENVCADHLPDSLVRLRARGVTVVPHGVSLGLGGAERPDARRLADLAERADALGSPLITEHIAFVRAGGPLTASPTLQAGHLLPVPRTKDALRVLCENVRVAQDSLPVPLAVENIAALINWPDEEMTEGQFLAELVERTGVRLLIDVANLHTNHVNRGEDPATALDELPVEAIAYVHVAGGVERDGVWHDTHAHPVSAPVLAVLAELRSRISPPGVLLERDDNFPPPAELAAELVTIRTTLRGPGPTAVRGKGVAAGTAGPGCAAPAPETPGPAEAGPANAERAATGSAQPEGKPGTAGPHATSHPVPKTLNPQDGPVPADGPANAERAAAGAEPAGPHATGGAVPAALNSSAAPRPSGSAQPETQPTDRARERLALAQAALLSALVAGTPAPEGFDSRRLGVQSRALAGKRAEVVAKVAPELPGILGGGYRGAFLAYAKSRPMRAGYRRDALDFAEHLLIADLPEDAAARRELTRWWRDRSGARPPGRATRIARVARAVLVGR
ncbi:DUF692 family multinuclear iron-containing protein [Streptomyces sp. NPDC051217]|uniref:DUF692 domain-containing protein n=1 Tax=Streptomyces sp. NPDC051217 TaxID=3365644 RepID=UPI0037AF1657